MVDIGKTYDEAAYPSDPVPVSSPDRMRAAGLFYGWRGADPETASVLEIGCGAGHNLIAIAAAAPRSRCVGFDLSHGEIERGRAMASKAGIGNVTLSQGDILTWPRTGEMFDYIVCHGVLTWLPLSVRAPLMELIGASLAPGGVAYVSYDSLPQAAGKAAMNKLIVEETRHIADHKERARRGIELLALLSRTQREDSFLRQQLDILQRTFRTFELGYFLHDWLEETYAPISPGDVNALAGAAGLRFAADARLFDLHLRDWDEEALAFLNSRESLASRHETMHLLDGHRIFREDLFVRADAPPPPEADPWPILTFSFIGDRTQSEDDGVTTTRYTISEGNYIDVRGRSDESDILALLLSITPNEMSADEVAARTGLDAARTREVLRELVVVGLVDAHASRQNFTSEPGDKPRVSQLVRGTILDRNVRPATLRHTSIEPQGDFTRLLLLMCDGTRTRVEIAAAMTNTIGQEVSVEEVDKAIAETAVLPLFES